MLSASQVSVFDALFLDALFLGLNLYNWCELNLLVLRGQLLSVQMTLDGSPEGFYAPCRCSSARGRALYSISC